MLNDVLEVLCNNSHSPLYSPTDRSIYRRLEYKFSMLFAIAGTFQRIVVDEDRSGLKVPALIENLNMLSNYSDSKELKKYVSMANPPFARLMLVMHPESRYQYYKMASHFYTGIDN